MIKLTHASGRNFLSFGNVPIEFDLTRDQITLIVGKNGHGKSVLVDLICFVLYGKPYRKITKGQLPNSINEKDCVGIVHFEIGTNKFKVIRGIKPNIFSIYKNGELVEEEAAVRDYQDYLTTQILGISYKTFCQVVVMGSAAFTPFMELPAPARREVVEDILDIAIFSSMNDLLKKRKDLNKTAMILAESQIESAKRDTEAQKRVIQILTEAVDERVAEERAAIADLDEQRTKKKEEREYAKIRMAELGPALPFNTKSLQGKTRDLSRVEFDIDAANGKIKSVHDMATCPTCLQDVNAEHKIRVAEDLQGKIHELNTSFLELSESVQELNEAKERYTNHVDSARALQDTIDGLTDDIEGLTRTIERHQSIIDSTQTKRGDVAAEQKKLQDIAANALETIKTRAALIEEKNLQDLSSLLLKDSGIKATIIKDYIPIINKMINKYLAIFGFEVNFHLDENFNETIKSRGRDTFTYNSFSEGQKRKIDVAILFAFRRVTELKNSANCNLLILDEIVDSSLDVDSREAFLDILALEGGNSFVISHTAPSYDVFNSVMEFKLTGDFSDYTFLV